MVELEDTELGADMGTQGPLWLPQVHALLGIRPGDIFRSLEAADRAYQPPRPSHGHCLLPPTGLRRAACGRGVWARLDLDGLIGPFYCLLQNLSLEELAGLKASLAQYFMEGPGKASGVTCLYFVEEGQRSVVGTAGVIFVRTVTDCSSRTHRKTPSQEGLPLEHVAGDRCIHEDVLGLTFRISPHAFFQVAGAWAQEGAWGGQPGWPMGRVSGGSPGPQAGSAVPAAAGPTRAGTQEEVVGGGTELCS